MTEFAFDELTRSMLVGQEAIDLHLLKGGSFVPLPILITAKEFTPYVKDSPSPRGRWSRDDQINCGRWALGLLQRVDQSLILGSTHMQRLASAGLGPHVSALQRNFGTMRGFKEEVGAPVRHDRGRYADWGRNEFFAYARRLHRRIIDTEGAPRKLTRGDIHAAYLAEEGPGFRALFKSSGLAILNEYLGYPNIDSWDRYDYVAWGARLLRANNGRIADMRGALDILSKLKRGPSRTSVRCHVDSIETFKNEATQEFLRQEKDRSRRLEVCRQLVREGRISEVLLERPEELLAAGARVILWQYFEERDEYLSSKTRAASLYLQDPDKFVIALAKAGSTWLTPGRIEEVASTLGIYDDLWVVSDDHLCLASLQSYHKKS